jgi:hypothetical protein
MIFRNALRHPFERRLVEIRKRVKPEPFDWYRFDSFANVTHFESLLPKGLQSVLELAGDEPVADIGAGDGDIALLLESLGCRVTAIDWPGVNANQMEGVRLLKRELGSSIEIREMEIDDQFRLDGERFGLVLALGLLYHLKNPFYFLERLARHSRYCLLSTVIVPPGRTNEAIAYLTRDRELHNDPTNYWFFSEAGMLRLLDRCGWDVRSQRIAGEEKDRFFCLAESRTSKQCPVIRLLDGWHKTEFDLWRWTGREFSAVIENCEGATRFELRFHLTPGRTVTLQPDVDGVALPAREYASQGDHVYAGTIPVAGRRSRIRVRVTGTFEAEGRELGIIVRLPTSTVIDDECGLRLLR